MTPQAYIEWLDKEIEKSDKLAATYPMHHLQRVSCESFRNALYQAKEKFITIQFTPSIASEKRKAAIQNGFDDYCEAHDLPYRNECPLCPPLTDELPENPSNFTDGLT